MDDGPPPRKRSRFFSAGKAKFGPLLSEHRKSDPENETADICHTGGESASRNRTDSAIPHNSNPSYQTSNVTVPTQNLLASSVAEPRRVENSTTQVESTEPAVSHVSTDHNGSLSNSNKSNRDSWGESAFSNLTVRDTRRDGIYGAQALIQKVTNSARGSQTSMNYPQPLAATFGNSALSGTQFGAGGPTNALSSQAHQTSPYIQSTLSGSGPYHVQAGPQSGHPSYPPLAHGYYTHPVHGQRVIPPGLSIQAPGLSDKGAAYEIKGSVTSSGSINNQILPPEAQVNPSISSTDVAQRSPFMARPPRQTVDLDRDASGNLLPTTPRRPIFNLPNQGISNLPPHAKLQARRRLEQPLIPPTLYTSPNRISNARLTARTTLKRKRAGAILPPPAYIYTRCDDPTFTAFQGILLYPELCFHLASTLPVADLISLYAISRDFHTIIDTRFTTVMLSQAQRKCPESARSFPFRCYRHLCRSDPAARKLPHPDPRLRAQGETRRVPSLRWLQMVVFREKVVHELTCVMAEDGVPLPARCSLALKRLWFLLDIPDNARRVGCVHNRALLSDLDLYFAMCFFVKLDMRCNDPVAGACRYGLRVMLLGQRSLSTVLKVLKREMWGRKLDVLRAWVEYRGVLTEEEETQNTVQSVFGVPRHRVGRGQLEYWGHADEKVLGRPPQRLMRPDELVVREAVRRGLRFHRHFLRCLLYGYVRPDTLDDYEPRALTRRLPALERDGDYGVDDDVGPAPPLGSPDPGWDELLDLHGRRDVSRWCVRPDFGAGPDEAVRRRREEDWLDRCMEWVEREKAQVAADG